MQSLVGDCGQLWNMGEALVLVNGVPREVANNIRPTEITQIIPPAAQAVVLYGSRGAKGSSLSPRSADAIKTLQVSACLMPVSVLPKVVHNVWRAEYMTLYNGRQ